MKRYEFHCRLVSDLIVTSNAATEAYYSSLTYIPGAKFLGIIAQELYDMEDEKSTVDLFHSGRVQFGDAHPLIDGKPYYPSPANYFLKKGERLSAKVYLHHNIGEKGSEKFRMEYIQLRKSKDEYIQPDIRTHLMIVQNYRLKSAFDPISRRSKDHQMFGYFSLPASSEWYFTVEDHTGHYIEKIKELLVGKKRVGKSKSAEYGLVDIKFHREIQQSKQETYSGRTLLYALSNLCFINPYGDTTAQPTAMQLTGSEGSTIRWEESQLSSRRYQSWNGKRNHRDMDRIIIQKGSVLVVDIDGEVSSDFFEEGLGSYKAEGFGKVLVNPSFLPLTGIKLGYSYSKYEVPEALYASYEDLPDPCADEVIEVLNQRDQIKSFDQMVKSDVLKFIAENKGLFRSVSSSQWGAMRAYAKQCLNYEAFEELVFNEAEGFIFKGVSAIQWRSGGQLLKQELKTRKKLGDQYALAFIHKLSTEITKS